MSGKEKRKAETGKPADVGPCYGVELIDVLPMNPNGDGMLQQMPSRADLQQAMKANERVVAGYEILLHHYRSLKAESEVTL